MLFSLIETPEFSAQRARLLSEDEFRSLQLRLLTEPDAGDVVGGTGGIRKVRVGIGAKGRRGGGRVVYVVRARTGRIYLLTCYAKGDQPDLTAAQRKRLRSLVSQLK
jgi:hypothetical protein